MKKVILGIFSLLFISYTAVAQVDAKKALKKASSALSAFNIDPANNKEKLDEAKEMIAIAEKSSEVADMAKLWLVKGEIYSTAMGQDLGMTAVDPNHKISDMNGAVVANEAFMMAVKKAVKKYETKDALKGLVENINNLSNTGIAQYKNSDMEAAFKNFDAVLNAHKVIKGASGDSPLDNKEQYNNALYLAALGALGSQKMDIAGTYFDELAANEYKDAAVYDGIYKANIDTNPEKALGALAKGRELFPDNTSLLFTEINYYLKEGKMDVLTGKLKTAIEKEPENVSLYNTLGNVYDNLFQKENNAGNTDKAKEYFDAALENYNAALKIDEKSSDAIYSIGALYYNKAANLTQKQKDLGISKADLKQFDVYQKQIDELFGQALPYFKRVEKLDPNDLNTLIALKEIYAKQSNFELSKEFKMRMETVQNKGKNAKSYFEGKE